MEEVAIMVPARLESTRLPRKLLLNETGMPLLVHTLKNLQELRKRWGSLWLVTDSDDLEAVAEPWVDGVHRSTQPFSSGSERLADALGKISSKWVLNVQADEPEVDFEALQGFLETLGSHPPEVEMATLATPFISAESWKNPNAVKVLVNRKNLAMTFSRAEIPHGGSFDTEGLFHHLGVYAYRRNFLGSWPNLLRGVMEDCERLEQLRALENGLPIAVRVIKSAHKGIDTPDDYRAFVQRFSSS
jgi:3-deoxy-manno-octulosonate cytidylyltransferase (CMP-KDO synthetase)